MKVLVLSNMAPFVWGGAEELASHLALNLQAAGVEAETCRLPFSWNPAERLIDEMLIARCLRFENVDRIIALKFPAYIVPWHDKVVWLLHQYRQAYDLLDAGLSNIPNDERGQEIISAIRQTDCLAFTEAKKIYTNSSTTSMRLHHYNRIDSTVLRPPLNDPEIFVGGVSSGYIVATGRVNAAKRQTLLIRALRYSAAARLVIAGPPDSDQDADRLRQLAAVEGVEDRVVFDLRLLSRRELAALVNGAVAVAYLPFDEDSVGYCTMEAFHAGKPVITTTDSGGVLDLVNDEETGLVVAPTPEALGRALDRLSCDGRLASRLGTAGKAALSGMELTWPATIEKLLS